MEISLYKQNQTMNSLKKSTEHHSDKWMDDDYF